MRRHTETAFASTAAALNATRAALLASQNAATTAAGLDLPEPQAASILGAINDHTVAVQAAIAALDAALILAGNARTRVADVESARFYRTGSAQAG